MLTTTNILLSDYCYGFKSHSLSGINCLNVLFERTNRDILEVESSSFSRRSFFSNVSKFTGIVSSVSSMGGSSALAYEVSPDSSEYWPLGKVAFSLLPLAGTYSRRSTTEEEVVKNTIWTHDQIQGVVNVNVPVRQVVIKLSPAAGGGLLVYNPVAPTEQLLKMMRKLEDKHGSVRHIILGTVALEHKATFGPFAQRFPKATVWLQPEQVNGLFQLVCLLSF